MSNTPVNVSQPTGLRHRITFATRKTLAYISVLELGRLWERTLRRARVPLKYSQGYNPRPKLHFAAPLPVGCGSEAELVDIILETPTPSACIQVVLVDKTPPDLHVLAVETVPEDEAALSEQLLAAEYQVWLRNVSDEAVREAVTRFLHADTVLLPKRGRKHRGKMYDLRALVEDLQMAPASSPWVGVWMRVSARPGATGRPDEVLKALDLIDVPRRCSRTRLILDATLT